MRLHICFFQFLAPRFAPQRISAGGWRWRFWVRSWLLPPNVPPNAESTAPKRDASPAIASPDTLRLTLQLTGQCRYAASPRMLLPGAPASDEEDTTIQLLCSNGYLWVAGNSLKFTNIIGCALWVYLSVSLNIQKDTLASGTLRLDLLEANFFRSKKN